MSNILIFVKTDLQDWKIGEVRERGEVLRKKNIYKLKGIASTLKQKKKPGLKFILNNMRDGKGKKENN